MDEEWAHDAGRLFKRHTEKAKNQWLTFPHASVEEFCRSLPRLQLTGDAEIPWIINTGDSDHWHISNLHTPLMNAHDVSFHNYL